MPIFRGAGAGQLSPRMKPTLAPITASRTAVTISCIGTLGGQRTQTAFLNPNFPATPCPALRGPPTLRRMRPRPTASERFLAVIGKSAPPPLTTTQLAEIEEAERRADEEIERLYGPRRDAAA